MNNFLRLRDARLLGVFAIACVLNGCGGGDSSASTTSESTPVSSATTTTGSTAPVVAASASSLEAPVITGTAGATVTVGQAYSFQPRVTEADTALTLKFAIVDAPRWATFDPATGRLSGTPTSADVGSQSGITVQVSNGMATATLAPFSISVLAVLPGGNTGNVSLSWTAPTENTNGSVLSNLGGYVIHYGTSSKNYTSTITLSNPGLTLYVIEDLPPGTYFFAMAATTTSGVESGLSPEASTTIT